MTSEAVSRTIAASGAGAGTQASENPNALMGQNEFLKIMVAQLQAQNPLEPGNSNEFLGELAQMTQVEQLTNLASAGELSSAVSLIGRTVSYESGAGSVLSGVVQSVQAGASGTTLTIEGEAGVKLTQITEVT